MSRIAYQDSTTATVELATPPGPPPVLSTLVDVARWRARNQHRDLAFTYLVDGEHEGGQLTYGELDRRARAIAAGLQHRSAAGQRVLLLFEPGLDYVAAVFGCLYAGALAVPVYPPDPLRLHRTLPRLQAIVADAGARFVFGSEEILRLGGNQVAGPSEAATLTMDELADGNARDWQPPDHEDGDDHRLALLQYTSGSTGSPRGVMLDHANLMQNLAGMHRVDSEGVVGVSWLPPYHDFGLIAGVLLPVYSGRRTILMSPQAFIGRPVRWLRAISRYRGKTTGAPNFAYELCARKIRPHDCEDLDLSCWTLAAVAAEPVRADTLDRFAEKFAPYGFRREAFLPCYGLAEAVLQVTSPNWRELPLVQTFSHRALQENRVVPSAMDDTDGGQLVGCGRPLPGHRVVIVDPKLHQELPPGAVGEIWVAGPTIAQGYWNRPEETERVFGARLGGRQNDQGENARDKYLRSGDLGFLHEGQLFVTGRLKELIILGGRNYYPHDIERTVYGSHASLKPDGGVAFSCDVDGQERLVVVQEARRSRRIDANEVLQCIRRELSEEYLLTPYAVVLIAGGTLPKTSSGKPRRRACRQMFLDGRLSVLAQWRDGPAGQGEDARHDFVSPRTPLEEEIASVWAEVFGVESVGVHDSFFDLGGNSLKAAELCTRLQDLAPHRLPLRRLFEGPTVAGLAEFIFAAHLRQQPPRRLRWLLQHLAAISDDKARRMLAGGERLVVSRRHARGAGAKRSGAPGRRRSGASLRSATSHPATSHARGVRRRRGLRPIGRRALLRQVDELSPIKRALLERHLLHNGRKRRRRTTISRRKPDQPLLLSFAEGRLWFFDQLNPGHPFYNLPVAARLTGPLDETALRWSLRTLAARHETLRTTFPTVNGEPIRKIASEVHLPISRVDLRQVPDRQRDDQLQRLMREEARRPFDLAGGPLLRCVLLRTGDNEHVVLLVMHHIVSDGWSMGVMLRELAVLYNAAVLGDLSPLPPLEIQYADFAAWQRKRFSDKWLARQFDYWGDRLKNASPLELPTDRPRPAVPSFEGATRPFRCADDLSARIRQLARQEGTTPFVVLLTAMNVLLSRYCRQTDVTVGTAAANRTLPQMEGLIGFFVNTLVLRTDLSGDPTFREAIGRVHETMIAAHAHQELPLEKLVEQLRGQRDGTSSPLFAVSLVLQNAPLELPTGSELQIEPVHVDNGTAKDDLTLFLWQRDDRLTGYAEYRTSLFEAETIDRLLGSLATLLESGVDDADRPVTRLPMIEPDERRQILRDFSHNGSDATPPGTLHGLFEVRAAATPNSVAVRHDGQNTTYAQIDRRANRLARHLKSHGIEAQRPVAVCLPRSPELIVAMLGVFKSGGAYLPLDTEQPRPRLEMMLQDAMPAAVITTADLADGFAETGIDVLTLEKLADELTDAAEGPPTWSVEPDQLAYVIYTSGSTGRPKGVAVEHRGVVNFVRAQNRLLGLSAADSEGRCANARVLQFFSPAFDGSIAETFNALATGACLVIGEPAVYRDGDALGQFIRREQVTVAQFTPSMLASLEPDVLEDLHTVVSAGEALSSELVERWAGGRRFFNAYGPTEASIGACMARIDRSERNRPTIGRPLENVRVYLLDEHLEPVGVGMAGEICIGGAGVARGYLNRPELTAERFLDDPFSQRPSSSQRSARIYRTGDLGRWRPDGSIEFLGRADDQVKLRGYRVEPGEIAAVLRQHPGVRSAAVVVREDCPETKRLVGYVVAEADRRAACGHGQKSPRATLEAEQLSYWQTLFDETFRRTPPPSDPAFHVAGWVSSRPVSRRDKRGRFFPEGQMRAWVDQTARRVLEMQPRRVLEIGCKTGLLLLRAAATCETYVGTDPSGATLAWLEQIVARREDLAGRVKLLHRTADRFDGLEPGGYDLIVLNSAVQYFPGVDYLLRVLEGLQRLVAPGGRILVGGVRSLPLQAPLAASIELAHAGGEMTREELLDRVKTRMEREQELLVHPALFDALPARLSRLCSADVLLKRGPADNELFQYRYDAVLHFDRKPSPPSGRVLDWTQRRPSAERVAELFGEDPAQSLTIRSVANARLTDDLALWRSLNDTHAPGSVARLRSSLKNTNHDDAIDPEDFWQLGEQLGCDVQVGCSRGDANGCYDVEFARQEVESGEWRVGSGEYGVESDSATPPDCVRRGNKGQSPTRRIENPSYTNDPLAVAASRQFVVELREHLRQRLPHYMIPAALVVLDDLPRTPQGKLDRRALPPPPATRPDWSTRYIAPRDEQEALIADVWQRLLGVNPVGVQDDFFEIGGHSMLAVRMVAAIEQQTGRRLPLAALFQRPTVEHLARLLREPEICPPESSLVPLREEGTGRPLFVVHPAGGTVFCYQPLAEHLGGDRAVYGLQAVGIDGVRPPHEDAHEMAAHYAAAVRTAQPVGPYLLAGWSLGGNLAFETARQLALQGETIELLALFDSGALPPDREPTEDDFLPIIMDLFPGDDDLTLEDLRQMTPEQHLEYFVERARKAGVIVPEFGVEVGAHVFEVFKNNLKAMWEYRPKPYPGKITLFASEQQPESVEIAQDPMLGWGAWADGGVEVHQIPGRHLDVIKEPNVRILARKLRECIEEVTTEARKAGREYRISNKEC